MSPYPSPRPRLHGAILWTVVFAWLGSTNLWAQSAPEEAELKPPTTGVWFGLYNKIRLSDRLFYYAETHYRRLSSAENRTDFIGRMGQVYNRHGLTYLVNENFEATLGPVLVLNFSPDKGNPDFKEVILEPRIWHQYLFIQPYMGRVKMYHQFRFEHRFKRDNNMGAEYKYTTRYRYKVYAYIPINKPHIENHTFYVSPSVEIFLHSGKSVVANPMEDVRIYTALGYIHNNLMFFGGHMYTIGQSRDPLGYVYRQRHIIRLNLFINLDLRKKDTQNPESRLIQMGGDGWSDNKTWN